VTTQGVPEIGRVVVHDVELFAYLHDNLANRNIMTVPHAGKEVVLDLGVEAAGEPRLPNTVA